MSLIVDQRHIVRSFGELATWFREELRRHDTVPREESAFARALRSLDYLAARADGSIEQVAPQRLPERLREAFSAAYLLRALRESNITSSPQFLRVASLFKGQDLCLTRTSSRSEERDHSWELLVAGLCARFCTDVVLAEPDVVCAYASTKWGIACKLPYSLKAERHLDQAVEGVRQIEESDCDLGIVMINVTNLVPHDELFAWLPMTRKFVVFRSTEAAEERISGVLGRVVATFNREDRVRRLIQNIASGTWRDKCRTLLLFAQTVVLIREKPALLTKTHAFDFRRIFGPEQEFTDRFNHAAQINFN